MLGLGPKIKFDLTLPIYGYGHGQVPNGLGGPEIPAKVRHMSGGFRLGSIFPYQLVLVSQQKECYSPLKALRGSSIFFWIYQN